MKQFLFLNLKSINLFFFFGIVFSAQAQLNPEDYARTDSVVKQMSQSIYNQVKDVKALSDSVGFWYKTKTRDGNDYYIVDSEKKKKRKAFEPENLKKQLNEVLIQKTSWEKLGLYGEYFSASTDSFFFKYKGKNWIYRVKEDELLDKGEIRNRESRGHWARSQNELGNDAVDSPDEKWTAYIQEYNLFLKNKKNGKKHQITFDGSPGEYYSSYIKWAPNSEYIAVNKFRPNEKRYVKFIESSPKDQLQPKLHELEYLKPGDALPIKRPFLFSIKTMKGKLVDFDDYRNQYNLTNPNWRNDSRAFTIEYNQRGHQRYSILEVGAENGRINVLAEETPETFFSYSGKKYRYDIDDGKEMIWMSERDGWNHLYLYDSEGNVKTQITKGQWVVRKVIHVDEENREIFFSAGGVNPNEDPYHIHFYRIGFNGENMTALTSENANHEVWFSLDYNYLVDNYSRADLPGKTVLRRTRDGKVLEVLEETDISDLEKTSWKMPEVFMAKGRDDKTDIWGLIYRPSNFDPSKKYPVIEYIYAGPHDSFVPKSFLGVNNRFAGLAELGFICVQIDGMGTSNRSKAFHDVCWMNLKDAGFPDRIKWMQAAAEKYPFMDIDRVGIFGGSAGGQSSTGAVLFYSEFYDVAVSSCGCHDNRMDKIWWNEQWMGYPIGAHYDSCSNVTNANKLQGNLMLILGEIDDNVDPASTMQLADALINADKEFELVILPGVKHTSGGNYGERKRRDFFVKHLLQKNTPLWNSNRKED